MGKERRGARRKVARLLRLGSATLTGSTTKARSIRHRNAIGLNWTCPAKAWSRSPRRYNAFRTLPYRAFVPWELENDSGNRKHAPNPFRLASSAGQKASRSGNISLSRLIREFVYAFL